jgi:hypothetical protein
MYYVKKTKKQWTIKVSFGLGVRLIMFITTFNNSFQQSWRSVLLVEETGIPAENHQPAVSHLQTLSHNLVSSTARYERDSNSQR